MGEKEWNGSLSLGAAVRQQLSRRGLEGRVFWRDETDSTNTWAKSCASCGEEGLDRALFMTERQTAGKGRFQRVWDSPAGKNLYMTLVLWKPDIQPENAAQLTLVMGLSVSQAVSSELGEPTGIKWPNDVVLSGKKICGILTEMSIKDGQPQYIIIGTGINVNQEEFPLELRDKGTSLFLESGRKVDRARLAVSVRERFEENYRLFLENENMSLLKTEYEKALLNIDQPVRILEKDRESRGTARGITDTGELLVEDQERGLRKIMSGEVSVRGLYSYV